MPHIFSHLPLKNPSSIMASISEKSYPSGTSTNPPSSVTVYSFSVEDNSRLFSCRSFGVQRAETEITSPLESFVEFGESQWNLTLSRIKALLPVYSISTVPLPLSPLKTTFNPSNGSIAVMSLGVASVFSNSDTDEVVTADEDVSVLAFWSPQAVAMVVSNTAAATAINFVLVIDVLLTLKSCSIVS